LPIDNVFSIGTGSEIPIPISAICIDQEREGVDVDFELLVIGDEREAIENALAAGRRGQYTALVQPTNFERGAIPIDVLREASTNIGNPSRARLRELRNEVNRILHSQRTADRVELDRLGVNIFSGDVRFLDQQAVGVCCRGEASTSIVLSGQKILLACGTRSLRPHHFRFDDRLVLDVESLLDLDELPRSLLVVGAGESGLDHALFLASMGVDVTVIDARASLLDVYGGLTDTARLFEAQSLDIAFRLGDEVIGVATRQNERVAVQLASGTVFVADACLVCVGHVGNTDTLNLEATGVGLDERGLVWCDADGGTWVSNIRAAGPVVGFRSNKELAG